MRAFTIGKAFVVTLFLPLLALGVDVTLSVQATASGTLGSTVLNRRQVRLILTVDPALITGAVGSQSTPNVAGTVSVTGINGGSLLATATLNGSARIVVSSGVLSFIQNGGGTLTVANPVFATTDLKKPSPLLASDPRSDIPGTAPNGALILPTNSGTLSIAAGARFSFHNFSDFAFGTTETFTFTSKTLYNTTNTTVDEETFQTRVTGRLNGGAPVYDQTFPVAFSDPTVQAAVNQVRAAITAAAGSTTPTITGPARISTARSLTNSNQQTVDGPGVFMPGVATTISRSPAFIYVGDEEATEFLVGAASNDSGQTLPYNNWDLYSTTTIPRTITTTNTYRTSETYALEGSTQAAPTGLRFVSLAPCRLMETRPEYNFQGRVLPFGPPFLNTAETRTFVPQLSNVCTVPSTAKAYVLNVTLVPRGTGVDFVTVFPAAETRPDSWTVRSPDGLIVANSATVKAGAGGAISVYTSNATDMLIDIAGYFTDNPQESNLVYYPLTPCRVIETRQAYRPEAGQFGPPTLIAKQTRNFRFPQSPDCAIPSGAAAYSVTLTVVPPAPLPFLTAWPAGASQPNVSSINSPNGRILANSVIVPASTDGSISLYPFETTDAIVDINGYFAPDNGGGLFYYPITQCRVSNSTDATFTGNFGPPIFQDTTTRTIPIASSPRCSGSPANAKAYALNATVIPNGNPMPFLTIFPTGQPQPNASVISAFEGQTVSSGFIVPAGTNGSIDVYAFRRTHVVIEIAGYFGR